MENYKYVEVIEFTDPICTWCWGSEPLIRKLEYRYGEKIKVKFIMGGLVRDIRQFYDSFHNIGGDAKESNYQIASHWLEASERHGMPVKREGFNLFSEEYPSSYPQNIAYKAAQMQSDDLANTFLRRIREATSVESKQTNRLEVLIELANESGLDIPKFIEDFTSGKAEDDFKKDLKITREYGVNGFPTFLIKYGERKILLKGYQSYDAIKAVIKSLTEDTIKEVVQEKTVKNVYEFILKYKSLAPIEIQTAFDLKDSELDIMIENLLQEKKIKKIPTGNKYFIVLDQNPLNCDIETGECRI